MIGVLYVATALGVSFYFVLGFGVSRMISRIKGREISIFDMTLWPVVCLIYAIVGDIQ